MLEKDVWLSNYFPNGGVYNYKPQDNWLSEFPSGFLYSKIKTQDYNTLGHLLENGFSIVELSLLFEQKKFLQNYVEKKDFVVRETRESDKIKVIEIASTAFQNARFYQDPKIDKNVASQIKKDWVNNFYTGTRGSHLFVCEKEAGMVVGFILMKENMIDLIATAHDHLGMGVASQLIFYANQKLGRLKSGTQSINTASLKLYVKNNFCPIETKFTLHKHT